MKIEMALELAQDRKKPLSEMSTLEMNDEYTVYHDERIILLAQCDEKARRGTPLTKEQIHARNEMIRGIEVEKKEKFKNDCLIELGLADHRKGTRAFEIAWDIRHAHGFKEVYNFLKDLSYLMTDAL